MTQYYYRNMKKIVSLKDLQRDLTIPELKMLRQLKIRGFISTTEMITKYRDLLYNDLFKRPLLIKNENGFYTLTNEGKERFLKNWRVYCSEQKQKRLLNEQKLKKKTEVVNNGL